MLTDWNFFSLFWNCDEKKFSKYLLSVAFLEWLLVCIFSEISNSLEVHILSGGNKLQIARSQLLDSGTYTCIASNVEGKAQKSFVLSIQGKTYECSENYLVIYEYDPVNENWKVCICISIVCKQWEKLLEDHIFSQKLAWKRIFFTSYSRRTWKLLGKVYVFAADQILPFAECWSYAGWWSVEHTFQKQ